MQKTRFLPTIKSLLLEPGVPFIHRDLSWLQFNERVLNESFDVKNPILERAKFLSITASNLDEFFTIRYSSLIRSIQKADKLKDELKSKRLKKIRSGIVEQVKEFMTKQAESLDLLTDEAEKFSVKIIKTLNTQDDLIKEIGEKIFNEKVIGFLPPPEILKKENLESLVSQQLIVVLNNNYFVRIPKSLPLTFVEKVENQEVYLIYFLDELLLTFIPRVLSLQNKVGVIKFIRDGDVEIDLEEEDSESIPDIVRTEIKRRDKNKIIKVTINGDVQENELSNILKLIRLTSFSVFNSTATLVLNGLWGAINQLPDKIKQNPQLNYMPIDSRLPQPFHNTKTLLDDIKKRDYLLHHPYDSFDAFLAFLKAASEDPNVVMIEQTIYRTDTLSSIVEILKKAAATKKVRVVIELRARFDEMNNLKLADELRKAGVEVCFGFGKLKIHAKLALVTKIENNKEFYYTHLSTGNYHSGNARAYTDLAILTANQDIGRDAKYFFDKVSKGELPTKFKILQAAPSKLHKTLLRLIDIEIMAAKEKKQARIFAKVNALVEEQIIEKLYEASKAGVKVDLVVRSACSLVPGVKGLSENIQVMSIVDRFLEHSRIYYFENSKSIYLSSADWMQRNFFNRMEIAFPILDQRIFNYIKDTVITVTLNDTVKSYELTPQGTWKKRVLGSKKIRSQFFFEECAKNGYKNTALEKFNE